MHHNSLPKGDEISNDQSAEGTTSPKVQIREILFGPLGTLLYIVA